MASRNDQDELDILSNRVESILFYLLLSSVGFAASLLIGRRFPLGIFEILSPILGISSVVLVLIALVVGLKFSLKYSDRSD